MIEIKLPNNYILRCQPTGKRKKIRNLIDRTLFMFENKIWEKLPESCTNLSDLNDGSEPADYNQYVDIYEEIK